MAEVLFLAVAPWILVVGSLILTERGAMEKFAPCLSTGLPTDGFGGIRGTWGRSFSVFLEVLGDPVRNMLCMVQLEGIHTRMLAILSRPRALAWM